MKQLSHSLFVIFFVVIMSACISKTNASSIEYTNVDDVISLQVVGSLPGVKGSQIFEQNEVKGKAVITKIVE